jgi:hypothetical protein
MHESICLDFDMRPVHNKINFSSYDSYRQLVEHIGWEIIPLYDTGYLYPEELQTDNCVRAIIIIIIICKLISK